MCKPEVEAPSTVTLPSLPPRDYGVGDSEYVHDDWLGKLRLGKDVVKESGRSASSCYCVHGRRAHDAEYYATYSRQHGIDALFFVRHPLLRDVLVNDIRAVRYFCQYGDHRSDTSVLFHRD